MSLDDMGFADECWFTCFPTIG